MPKIQISDHGKLIFEISPDPLSAIRKYINADFLMLIPTGEFLAALDVPLQKVELNQATTMLEVQQGFPMGSAGETELEVGTGGGVRFLVANTGSLFDDDAGDPVPVPAGKSYVGLGFDAKVKGGVSNTALPTITFGFSSETDISLATYLPFDNGLKFSQGARGVLDGFEIPGDVMDLARLPVGGVCTVAGTGKLSFDAEVSLSQNVVNLALDLPLIFGKLRLDAGGAVKVGAGFAITGGFEVRVHRASETEVLLSFHRQKGREFTFSVDARYGVTSKREKTDLIAQFLSWLNPGLDINEAVQQGAMTQDQVAEIRKAVKDGIDRSLVASVEFQAGRLHTDEGFFLFSFDPRALTKVGQDAINRALDGDVGPLLALPEPQKHGVVPKRSLARTIEEMTHSWRINLLGILNFLSREELTLQSDMLVDPATGDLTITDRATGKRLRAVTFHPERELRNLLAEQAVATAAYTACGLFTDLHLASTYTYTSADSDTSWEEMKDYLDTAEGMALVSKAVKKDTLASVPRFGRSLCSIAVDNDGFVSTRIFLKDTPAGLEARSFEEFVEIGKQALQQIVRPEDSDSYRLKPLAKKHWDAISKLGAAAGIVAYLQDKVRLTNVQANTCWSDWQYIVNWAGGMSKASERIMAMRRLLPGLPVPLDPQDPRFEQARKDLAAGLKDVVRLSREHFGDAYGLLALDIAAGRMGKANLVLTASRLPQPVAVTRPAVEIAVRATA